MKKTETKRLNAAIVGGGAGCKALIELILSDVFSELKMSILGVASLDPTRLGAAYAKNLGIHVTSDYKEFYGLEDLNLIIELTGRDEVLEEILRTKPPGVKVMDHVSARLFWDFMQTEEKYEKEIKESRDHLQNLLQAANDLIYTVDLKGNFTYLNPRIQDYGYTADELLGKHFLTILVGKHRGRRFERAIQERVRQSYEAQVKTKDGVTKDCIISTSPLLRHDGKPTGVLGIMSDITEKKRTEEEIRKKNEELESFVYVVSHDLKAPLISLQGFSSVLLKDYQEKLGEEGRRYLERIKANVRRMEILISDLLALSRIGRVVNPFKDVSSLEIVKRVCSTLNPQLEKNRIEVSIGDDLPTVYCDEDRLYQVLQNLLGNAIKFIGDAENPKIEIGYEEKDEFHQFYVRDNGIGIDPKYRRKIFEIFCRLKEIEDEEGTGIGLVIVERIISNHGGKVWVESEKDKGATFYFTLSKTPSPAPLTPVA